MHEIDTSGHVANQFADADPGGPTAGTIVNDDWLNAVQNEIVNAIEDAGITLVKGTNDQLSDAIRLTITNVAHTFTAVQTFSEGVSVTQSTSNATAVVGAGNGSGNGANFFGGTTGTGVYGEGGTSGAGTSGRGGMFQGKGTSAGVRGTGGATAGIGVEAIGGGGAGGVGLYAEGGATNGKGAIIVGTGSGNALEATTAASTGYAAFLTGNSTRAPLLLGSLAAAPSATDAGAVYYNSTDGKLYVRNGVAGAWQACN